MLTVDGCKRRVQQLLEALQPEHPLFLSDQLHLRYFANSYVDPFSMGADYGAVLMVQPDGRTKLFHDSRTPKTIEFAFADEKHAVPWYDGVQSETRPRRLVLLEALQGAGLGTHLDDNMTNPQAARLYETVNRLRRAKQPDEVELLKHCMTIAEAGQSWARTNAKAGMTELDVYAGISRECTLAAGYPVIVYGDFAVSPGSEKRGGMATNKILHDGETLILDFSVVVQGYRSDFTNTLVIGGKPTVEQQRLFDVSLNAMRAGEAMLHPGASCKAIYEAVFGVFDAAGLGANFPHHAGHGLGLAHPESPFLVKNSADFLQGGDVVTLEPGCYVDGVGGVRIEHNYLVTATGHERLSHHTLGL